MAVGPYLLGLDVSTTAAKALLIDSDGLVVGAAANPLGLSAPRPLWSEQDPADWWLAMAESIRHVLAKTGIGADDIAAIGLTGQMHGLVMLDEQGEVLRPAMLWNDQRTAAQCGAIRERIGRERLIRICGNDALTGFTAPKILWVRDEEPDIYDRTRHILLPKDYIRYRLSGEYAMDRAGGSGTMLFDLAERTWSDELLSGLDIPRDWLPRTYEGPEVTGTVSFAAAAEAHLRAGTPIVGGGGDQAAQAVGVGAVTPGIVALTLGTSGVVFTTTKAPLIEPDGRLHAFCHAIPERWHFMGVMLSAAGSLQWYRDTLAREVSYDQLLAEADAVPPGSEGLFFLPYLTGERTPHPDPLARGAWVGLTSRHGRGHLSRSVLEGVAYGIRDSFTLIQAAGVGPITQVRLSGGGARSTLWRQIMADVLGTDLVMVNTTEGAAFGAALLAGVGSGNWVSVEEACRRVIHVSDHTSPNRGNAAIYDCLYPHYQALYPALRPTFQAVA